MARPLELVDGLLRCATLRGSAARDDPRRPRPVVGVGGGGGRRVRVRRRDGRVRRARGRPAAANCLFRGEGSASARGDDCTRAAELLRPQHASRAARRLSGGDPVGRGHAGGGGGGAGGPRALHRAVVRFDDRLPRGTGVQRRDVRGGERDGAVGAPAAVRAAHRAEPSAPRDAVGVVGRVRVRRDSDGVGAAPVHRSTGRAGHVLPHGDLG